MAKLFLFVVLFVMVKASHKHHPKFPKGSEDYDVPLLKKEACSSSAEMERNQYLKKSRCGEPKDVFIHLHPQAAHEQITPGAVWVKRCVGLCDDGNQDSKCIATKTRTIHIPVRIETAKTNKYTCSTYPVEEHLECGCCSLSADECPAPRVYNRRKCSCQCPNMEERRSCLKKRNMRWNRSKCTCEERRRMQW